MLSVTFCLALLAPQGPAPVVINEFVYDDSSTDDREFVELYNNTAGTVSIGGWVLESANAGGVASSFVIPSGTMLPAGGFWVMGAATVPNVNQVVGTTDIWDNAQNTLTLRDSSTPVGNVIDTLVYEANKGLWPTALPEGEGIWGNFTSIDTSTLGTLPIETSWSRTRDGQDTNDNGCDFSLVPATPGTSNNLTGTFPYVENFDLQTVDTPAAGWGGSFEYPYITDPTTVGAIFLGWIPGTPSPQGGRSMAMWDTSGGGNSAMLLSEVPQDVVMECYVYLDSGLEAAFPNSTCLSSGFEYQTWSIGFGNTGTYYNHADPTGILTATANGNTGVSWTYQITDQSATLYFINHNNGGWGANAMSTPTVVGQIAIMPGVNDGWQRIRIERVGGAVVASFGNTPGCADGTSFNTVVPCSGPDTLYLGYREFICDNNNDCHPVVIDDISVKASTGSLAFLGSAFPTNTGTPTIGVNGAPTVGNQGFAITVSDLVPSGAGVMILGTLPTSFPVPSGCAGANLEVVPQFTFPSVNSASGTATFPAPLACNPTWAGFKLYWQYADVDLTLPCPTVKVGVSQGMETTIGG